MNHNLFIVVFVDLMMQDLRLSQYVWVASTLGSQSVRQECSGRAEVKMAFDFSAAMCSFLRSFNVRPV